MVDIRIDDGTFEANANGWFSQGGTKARSTAQAHSGVASCLLTVTGTPSQAYIRTLTAFCPPVTPFQQYTFGAWARSASALTMAVSADWYTAGLSQISTSTGSTVVLAPNTWTKLPDLTAAAPATAAIVSYGATTFSPGAGTSVYFDDMTADDATPPPASIDVIEQDVWPPRLLVTVSNLTPGDAVTIYRVVAGQRTALRGGSVDPAVSSALVAVDAELPFGVPVHYVAAVGDQEYATAPATYQLPGGLAAFTDAITGLSAEGQITRWPDMSFDRQASVSRVRGRNVAVVGPLGDGEGDAELYFETAVANQQFRTLLDAATEGIIQIRQPGGYGDVDGYYATTAAKRTRFSQDGTDDRRLWTVHLVQVDGWPEHLEAAGYSYADLADFYSSASGTYADLADDQPTYLAIAQAEWA